MKKLLSILLCIMIVLSLISCQKTKNTKCGVCKKQKQCFQVKYHNKNGKEESHWVCSNECKKKVDALATLTGYENN